jgi:hypothetical protein
MIRKDLRKNNDIVDIIACVILIRAKNSVHHPLYVRREALITHNGDVKSLKISIIDYGKLVFK